MLQLTPLVWIITVGLVVVLLAVDLAPILHWAHVDLDPRVPEIPTLLSLAVIILILVTVTVASLVKSRRDPSATAHAGSLRARPRTPVTSDQE